MTATQFPDWYRGGFPDRELVVVDLLQPFLDLMEPKGVATTWLPNNYEELLPIVRVYRGGGASDEGVLRDPASVQVAVIADNRAESWAVMEYCRQMLLSYNDGGPVRRVDGSFTKIRTVYELVGPQNLPELDPDLRMVPLTFGVECLKPADVPDYALIRAQLDL